MLKNNKISFLMISFLIFSFFLLSSCRTTPLEEQEEKEYQENLQKGKELQDEIVMGREMAAKLYGTFGEYRKSKKALLYLNLLGRSLGQQVGRPEIIYRFGIIDEDEPNAFSTPGGYILVTKGLLKFVKNETELAAVLSHEIAHINAKHMYNDLAPKREVGAGENITRILSRGVSDIGSSLSKAVTEGMKLLLEKGLSPEKEYEADSIALTYLTVCGYNPYALTQVLQRLQLATQAKTEKKEKNKEKSGEKSQNKTNSSAELAKTHPSFEIRLEKIKFFLIDNRIKDDPGIMANANQDERFKNALGVN